MISSFSLLDIKHQAELKFHLQRGTLARATRVTEYVRARKWFVDTAFELEYSLREIDRFMGWSNGAAWHYKHREQKIKNGTKTTTNTGTEKSDV